MSGLRRLIVFGDSYIEGQRKDPILEITKYNMCYFLGKELDIEVVNMGKFGSGNTNIAHNIMRYVSQNDVSDCAFLICWSDMSRYFALHPTVLDDGDKQLQFDAWQYISSPSASRLDNEEFKRLNPETRNLGVFRMLTEQAIHSVRSICDDYRIPFLMTNSIDSSFLLNKWTWRNEVREIGLIKGRVKERWIEPHLPNNTIFDILTGHWLREDIREGTMSEKHGTIRRDYEKDKSKYPHLTGCFHPTDSGNELIAKTLAPYIKPILEK